MLVLVSLLYFAKYIHDRRAVIHEIEYIGGTLQRIRSRTGLLEREWDVRYLDSEGKSKNGICYVQRLWGGSVFWKHGVEHAPKLKPLPTVSIDCQCGAKLDVSLSQAGVIIRCSSCSRELSVPSRSELQKLAER